ncbi:MAG: SPFH domain-containing protein [Propionibacteriaceae bacterium]|jgi:hypothetical protein|nr:SPFH domain-containing protein [Propionibacteriaceae bacterium]
MSIPSTTPVAPDPAPSAGPVVPPVSYPSKTKRIISEKKAPSIPGLLGLLILLAIVAYGIWSIYAGIAAGQGAGDVNTAGIIIGVILLVVAFLFQSAFTIVQPGQTKVLQFLGNYVGTIRSTGLRMTYPFTTKRQVSVKVRNFETREIKVNDSQGNPVVIAAIIVWQVQDTAQSVFQVEFYEQFVQVQSEAALRHIATIHPYDNGEAGEATLRGATDQVAAELAHEVEERVSVAGVDILETRISSLSYAPEIASAMLQRQQAQAVLAARAKIVEGAVTMVESALSRIENEDIVHMDDDRKAAMVANLLVVLCSDSRAMPTVNTGM